MPGEHRGYSLGLPSGGLRVYSVIVRNKGAWRRTVAAVAIVLALVGVRGWAQAADGGPGLEQLVREAMARDTTLQQRQLAVRRSQIGVAMTAAGRGFALALRLSDPEGPGRLVGVTVNEADGAKFRFGAAAGVTADLPHPFGELSTTATLTGPADEDPDGETSEWELGPVAVNLSSGVEQSLGPLLGLDATDADDLTAAHAVVSAEREVRQRTRAIAFEILDRVMAIIEADKAERSAVFELAELEAEVVRRREVFERERGQPQLSVAVVRRGTGAARAGQHPAPAARGARRPRTSRPGPRASAHCPRRRSRRRSKSRSNVRRASWMQPWSCARASTAFARTATSSGRK